ncbi:MAG: RNA 2',3'-cyclic phosphodiesterase [Desulfomonile sp.]|nr:RNA 2',3'-cyclic phosphodiesterase [Desulfomonile sp.]
MSEVRAFIAIELPEGVKFFLKEIVAELKSFGGDVRWTRPEGIHLTLKFLGNVQSETIPTIRKILEPELALQQPFSVAVRGLGAFPGLNRPRVLWVGVSAAEGTLAPLVAKVEELMEPLGFPKETREFNPHLTIGRVKSGRLNRDLTSAIRQMGFISGPGFEATSAVLFQSILKPSGAEYVPLAHFPFRG